MRIGLPTLLFLVFLVLKLTGVVAWSWLWILAPLWIAVLLWIGGIVLIVVTGAKR